MTISIRNFSPKNITKPSALFSNFVEKRSNLFPARISETRLNNVGSANSRGHYVFRKHASLLASPRNAILFPASAIILVSKVIRIFMRVRRWPSPAAASTLSARLTAAGDARTYIHIALRVSAIVRSIYACDARKTSDFGRAMKSGA